MQESREHFICLRCRQTATQYAMNSPDAQKAKWVSSLRQSELGGYLVYQDLAKPGEHIFRVSTRHAHKKVRI